MMYFENDCKINFVDINNVFVGYDLAQSCCEESGWFVSTTEAENPYEDNEHYKVKEFPVPDISNYSFDISYFTETPELVRFKLIAINQCDLYLHLFNIHNGYYQHGFMFKTKDKILKDSTI